MSTSLKKLTKETLIKKYYEQEESITLLEAEINDLKNQLLRTTKIYDNSSKLKVDKNLSDDEINKQTLETLEQRLILAFEGAEIGFWDHDIENNKVWRSKHWFEMLGYNKSNFGDTPEVWKDLIHPEDLESTLASIGDHYKNIIDDIRIEHRLRNSDNNYQWILNWGRIIERNINGTPKRAAGVHLDITKLKRSREESIQSVQRYKYLFENQSTIIWEEDFSVIKKRFDILKGNGITDFDKYFDEHPDVLKSMASEIKIVEMNPVSLKILEADSMEELSKSIPDYFNSEGAWKVFKDELVVLSKGDLHFESEISIKTIKGNLKHLYLILSVHPDHKNDLKSILVSFQDITTIKETAKELLESQKKYSALVEQANEGIIIAQEWKIKYSNQYFYNMLGYTHDEILKAPIESLLSNIENTNLIKSRYEGRLKGESVPNIYEAEAITKDGRIIPIEINAHTIEYEGQTAVQSIVRDISGRRKVEDESKQKQKELDLIYNATSDIMSLIKVDGDDLKLVSFNNSFWESVHQINPDLTKADLIDSSIYESGKYLHWSKSYMENMLSNYKWVIKNLEPLETYERIPFGPITKHFNIKHTPICDTKGNCSHILLSVQDITEQKKIEKTLSESEKFLKKTQNIASLGTYNYNITTGTWVSSEIMNRIFGIDESFNRSVEGWISLIHPEWQEKMHNYVVNYVLGGKNKFDKEYKVIRYSDKAERWVHGIGEVKYDENGVPLFMLGTISDITERINANIIIKQQDEYVGSIFRSAPVGIGVVTNRVINKVNSKLCSMVGFSEEELLGKSSRILYPSDDEFNRVGYEKYSQIENRGHGIVETKWLTKNGNLIDIILSSTPMDQENLLKGVTFTALDNTERKEAESALLKSRQRFESLFHNSPVPLWEENFTELYEYIEDLKKQGIKNFREYFEENIDEVIKCSRLVKIESVNKATLELHKAKNKEELLGNLDKVFTENSIPVFREEIITIAEGGSSFESESEVKTLTGENIIIFLKFIIQENNRALLATVDITKRQKAELALAKSEQSLFTLMNNIPGMAYQCLDDDAWTMTFVNKECSNLIGLEPDQIIQNEEFSYNELIHPDDREYVRIKVEEKLNIGEPFEIEYRIITANGKEKWVWERGTKVKEKVGGRNVLEGVIHDITERKLSEKALNELAKLNHQILDAAMDGYILADTNGNIQQVNPSYCKMIGYSESELLKMNVKELEVDIPKEIFEERVKAMVTVGGVTFKTKHKNKEGTPIDLDVSITVIEKGNETFIAALVRDITEQIKAAEKLKESEEKYRLLIENQTDLVVKINNENKFKFVSASYCKLFGKSEKELLGNSFIPLVHEDDRLATEKEMENLFREPFTCKVEQRAMTVNGWRWLEWNDKAIFDENNKLISIFGVGRDITDKKLAEFKLKESEERFKQLFNNMGSGVAIFEPIEEGKNFILENINKAGQEISNVKKDEIIGGKLTDIFPNVSGMGLLDVIKEVYKTNIPIPRPIILYKDSRIERYFENYCYKLPSGQIVAIYEDASAEKKALEALKNNEEDLRAILNTSFDAIILIHKNGSILEANKVFCNLINKKREEILNKSVFNFIKSENEEKRKMVLAEIFKTKTHANFIDEAYGRIWDFSVYPILDSNEEISRLTIFAKDITDKSIFEKKLKETNEKLRNLTRYMNNVREEERKNVAREVHDNLGQKLTALNLDISWIKQSVPDEISHLKEQFDPVLSLINESIITVQKISTELRPGILDDLGLINAIQWQSNEISRRSKLKFSLNLYKKELELSDVVKTELFRVYQEALTNIVRHADASAVLVNLLIKEKKLIFEVIDDGKGFLEANLSDFRAYGIMGMKERIASINGDITFTNLEKGTKLQIKIPIKEQR